VSTLECSELTLGLCKGGSRGVESQNPFLEGPCGLKSIRRRLQCQSVLQLDPLLLIEPRHTVVNCCNNLKQRGTAVLQHPSLSFIFHRHRHIMAPHHKVTDRLLAYILPQPVMEPRSFLFWFIDHFAIFTQSYTKALHSRFPFWHFPSPRYPMISFLSFEHFYWLYDLFVTLLITSPFKTLLPRILCTRFYSSFGLCISLSVRFHCRTFFLFSLTFAYSPCILYRSLLYMYRHHLAIITRAYILVQNHSCFSAQERPITRQACIALMIGSCVESQATLAGARCFGSCWLPLAWDVKVHLAIWRRTRDSLTMGVAALKNDTRSFEYVPSSCQGTVIYVRR